MEPDYLYVAKELSEADWPLYYNLEMPNNISDVMKQRIARERDKFVVQDGQVWRKVKVGPSVSLVQFCPFSRRADLVSQFHEGFGHAGQATVFELLKKRWWWPTMRLDLNNWLSSCRQCQLATGAGKGKHHAPMIPSDVPSAFARWHLDFPWYNPTVSRAAWRAEMGLSSGAAGSSGVVGSSGVAGAPVDRGRSQSLGGNDVVSKVRRFKPTVSTGSGKHCRGSRPHIGLRLNNIHANVDCH
ncbi:hypothetical protein G6F57_016359 [Rhizopus arrhizus]|nr:hypothetical protein G6F30_013212 [Rhizopus arrhizus]KAG0972985.1 hypothetical protein G6F29_013129 [Rhizopus arrhizus]KAG1001082.1 hypothetical protein G6F27_013207 [Rhizopus arrhizus]KAG1015604.1 hypothetical protein G6F26_013161 [Rhizopus arrhizus]KAG1023190.1 hypothetical protein G6F25_013086 [Rhizopus arrhizus]